MHQPDGPIAGRSGYIGNMQVLRELAARVYDGNSLGRWAEAAAIFLVMLTVLPLLRLVLDRRLKGLHPRRSAGALELLIELHDRTTLIFIMAVSVYAALKTLQLPTLAVLRFISLLLIWALALLLLLSNLGVMSPRSRPASASAGGGGARTSERARRPAGLVGHRLRQALSNRRRTASG